MKPLKLKKYKVNIDNHELILYDIESSRTLDFVIPEAIHGDEYKTKNVDFKPGDVVIDIGANVGSVSIMLAKKYPFLKIYSYEAHPINFQNLQKNIKENNVSNIKAFNNAVFSEDNYFIDISLNIDNTGASNSFIDPEEYPDLYEKEYSSVQVPTISLDTIIKENDIQNIKLLKIDCEGAEFDIFSSSELINQVPLENVGIEIHLFMERLGKNRNELVNHINRICKNPPIIKYNGL